MKQFLEKIIQKRNPAFHFDPHLNTAAILQFAYLQAIGILRSLRLLLYGRSPKLMLCGRGVRFFNISKIHWGKFLKLGDHVYLSGLAREGLFLGNNVGIGAYSRVVVSTSLNDIGSFIKIGNNVGIGEYAYLGGAGGLEIGDDCIVGQYLSCHPENHLYADTESLIRDQGISRKGIRIGANCWIGSKVTILDGVEIGEGCVIAAGSVVTKSIPAYSVIGGIPAKILKSRLANETYHSTIKKSA
jgi:acetyltransferase-like isoleucine patch superfamily enzyme